MKTAIRLYNTLRRAKENFVPMQADRVTMYVCGPTVYNFAHIGNARPAVVFDVLARLLRYQFGGLVYARNFTDVDDKINDAASKENVSIDVIARRYIDAYRNDMQQLCVESPDLEPRVTEHIAEIIALIEKLISNGNAYEANGHVLFDVASYPDYGKLSGRSTDDMLAGARVEIAPYKKNPMDFVLWKPSDASQPGWNSPWGRGRPGWHVECSAMIERHLGDSIDIHGGGQDLIFPHHENEVAQGTCAHDGTLYCNTWVHNSFVTVDGRKMSKSLGNVLLVRDLLQQAPGEAIRLALLSAHYRHPLDWNSRRLAAARTTLTTLYRALASLRDVSIAAPTTTTITPEVDDVFFNALANDLNTPAALTRLHALASNTLAAVTPIERQTARALLIGSASLLGLLQADPDHMLRQLERPVSFAVNFDAEHIESLLEERENARTNKDFQRADALRKELEGAGLVLEDSPTGTRWHWRSIDAGVPEVSRFQCSYPQEK